MGAVLGPSRRANICSLEGQRLQDLEEVPELWGVSAMTLATVCHQDQAVLGEGQWFSIFCWKHERSLVIMG